jgi:hypothetical protein
MKNINLDDVGSNFCMKFMPRMSNPADSVLKLSWITEPYKHLSDNFISYVLLDGVMETLKFGKTLHNMLKYAVKGYVGTPEGHVIADVETEFEVNYYYATEDKSYITLEDDKYNKQTATDRRGGALVLHKFNDQVEYKHRNPFDLTSDRWLSFTVEKVSFYGVGNDDLLSIENLRWEKNNAIYVNGDPKEPILTLYDGVEELAKSMEEFKTHLRDKYQNVFFDQDATKMYWGKRTEDMKRPAAVTLRGQTELEL